MKLVEALKYALVAAAIGLLIGAAAGRVLGAEPPPNFVVIVGDDVRADDVQRIPALASIAAAGTTFNRMYTSFPLCSPARASLLTGEMPSTHGVIRNEAALFDPSETIATWLAARGYDTRLIGKYLNKCYAECDAPPPGWHEFWPVRKHTDLGTESSDIIAGRAAMSIAAAHEPFLVMVPFVAAHGPLAGPARYDSATPPPFVAPPTLTDPELLLRGPHVWNRRWRSLQGLSDGIATIRAALAERGVEGRTVLLFVGDNGFQLGEHNGFGKNTYYEEAIRVPLLVSGPGVVAQTRRDLVGMTDIAPTLLELAGAPVPASVEGASLAPLLAGATPAWRDMISVEGPDFVASRRRTIKTVYPDSGAPFRFDSTDPYETNPLPAS